MKLIEIENLMLEIFSKENFELKPDKQFVDLLSEAIRVGYMNQAKGEFVLKSENNKDIVLELENISIGLRKHIEEETKYNPLIQTIKILDFDFKIKFVDFDNWDYEYPEFSKALIEKIKKEFSFLLDNLKN